MLRHASPLTRSRESSRCGAFQDACPAASSVRPRCDAPAACPSGSWWAWRSRWPPRRRRPRGARWCRSGIPTRRGFRHPRRTAGWSGCPLGQMYATSLRAAKSTLSSDSSDFAPMLIPRRLRSAMTFLLVVFLVDLSRKLLSRYKTVRTSRIFPVPVLPCRLRRFRQPSPMPE